MRKLAYTFEVDLPPSLVALLKAANAPLPAFKPKTVFKPVTPEQMPWPPAPVKKPAIGFTRGLNPRGKLISTVPPVGKNIYDR